MILPIADNEILQILLRYLEEKFISRAGICPKITSDNLFDGNNTPAMDFLEESDNDKLPMMRFNLDLAQ